MNRPLRVASPAGSIGLVLVLAATGFAQAPPTGPAPGYKLVLTSAKKVHDELTFGMEAPRLVAEDWVVFAARLPELPGQVAVRSALLPGGQAGVDLSPLSRPILMARYPVQEGGRVSGLTVKVEYDATLLCRKLERREPGSPPGPAVEAPSPRERRAALEAGHHFDYEAPAFQRWLEDRTLHRKPGEGEVDFGRRVFLEIKEKFRDGRSDKMDRSASNVCQVGQSDGGGLSILFVSALRANGIPARVLVGRWALPSTAGRNAADEIHAKSEFFAAGVGWVPVDLGASFLFDKAKGGLDYFGVDKGDFLTLHVDTDVEFDTIHFGPKTMETLQSASFWALGSGSFDGCRFPVSSKIKVEEISPSALAASMRRPGGRAAPAASKKSASSSAGRAVETPGQVTASGIIIDKQADSMTVRVDGEAEPVKYALGEKPDTGLLLDWRNVFPVARVRLVSRAETDPRELVAIARPNPRPTGTITGEVLFNHGWWVELKPKDGPVDGFAVHFSGDKTDPRARAANDAMLERVKGLQAGDVVTIRYTTDFERHRIETLRKKDDPAK